MKQVEQNNYKDLNFIEIFKIKIIENNFKKF